MSFRKDGTFRISLRKSFQSCLLVLCSLMNLLLWFPGPSYLYPLPGFPRTPMWKRQTWFSRIWMETVQVSNCCFLCSSCFWCLLGNALKTELGTEHKSRPMMSLLVNALCDLFPPPVHDSLVPQYRKGCFSGIKGIDATRSPFPPFPVFYLGALTVLHLH